MSTWRQFRRHRFAVGSLVFLSAVVALALAAPLFSSAAYDAAIFTPLRSPTPEHIMGTDDLGRDLWSRVLYGARISLIVGFGSQVIAAGIGIPIGAVAGYLGGWLDAVLMRLTDITLALPGILMALLFLTVFGNNRFVVMFAIGLATWPILARVVRSRVVAVRQEPFVEAARSIGCSDWRVLRFQILPFIPGPVIVQLTYGVSQAIYTEAFLSFLGLGAPPPAPSWGRLVVDGLDFVRTSPYLVVFPALAITMTILALNFLGDGLRDAVGSEA